MTDRFANASFPDLVDPSDARPLPSAFGTARADVLAAAADLLAISDAGLVKPWDWIGGSEEEVRYGAYRAAEALEQAEIEARSLVTVGEATERRAALIVGPATAARWDLHGLLVPLDDALLDADPGGGEWSIRQTLGHTINSQRGYGWGSAYWLGQTYDVADPALPKGAPESYWDGFPDEETTEAEGDLATLRARLDAILDLCGERFGGLADERLELGSRWSGFAVTVGFRLGRWSSHFREHAIQIEKTFAFLGHVPSEQARLIHNLLAAYGRAEAVVFGRAGAGVDAAADRIARAAAEAREATSSARAAAEAT
jgi:hypothetical protein